MSATTARRSARVLADGRLGEVYNVGGWNEKTNLDVVHTLCDILDELDPKAAGSYRDQITYVQDRPGHDRRYAIDARKIERELGWKPAETFETGIRKTVHWYLDHQDWVRNVQSGDYLNWIDKNYASARKEARMMQHRTQRHHPRRRLRHAPVSGHAWRCRSNCCRCTTSR